MFIDRPLSIALAISLFFHAVIMLPLSYVMHHQTKEIPLSKLEITYLLTKEILPEKITLKEKAVSLISPAPNKENRAQEYKVEKNATSQEGQPQKKVDTAKPALAHNNIEIPPELPKEKQGLYLNYYQAIREKIRSLVVENYPHYIACGEVCLYFVLSANGNLMTVEIVQERTTPNRLLKEIAKRSLKEAAPFLPFPKELQQPQLSFNVIISFEFEE